jgi:two-component system, chemotaxis family, chemotaxis protein CheY
LGDRLAIMNALIIDDSKIMLRYNGEILRELNFEVAECTDGLSALDYCKENPDIDLILCDIYMPKMDGIEFLKNYRQLFGKRSKIIMVTGVNELKLIKRAIEYGTDEYVMKPFDKEILITKLEMLGFPIGENK